MLESVDSMSDAQHNAMQILKHWVLNLRVGNDPTPEAWAEVREKIALMPEAEKETMRALAGLSRRWYKKMRQVSSRYRRKTCSNRS